MNQAEEGWRWRKRVGVRAGCAGDIRKRAEQSWSGLERKRRVAPI